MQERSKTVSNDSRKAVDKEELRTLVAEVLELPAQEVTDDADFYHELGVYSLLVMEVILRVEKYYGITIKESEIEGATSLDRVYELLTAKLQVASR